jgi:hypothetical protein
MRSFLLSKKILLILPLLIILSVTGFAQVTPVWEKTVAGANLPLWFGTDTERGMAYGFVGGNERIYVVSRKTTTPSIIILNAATGDSVGVLDVTGITGGLYTLNDVEVSDDGIIYACNMTTGAATTAFKVYKWTSEAAAPVEVLSYNVGAYRMGDKFTVVGSASDNSITIYAAVAANNKVIRFTTTDGIAFTFVELVATGLTGNTPAVEAVSPGVAGFFVNSNGISPKEYTSASALVGTLLGDYISTGSNAMRYFTVNSRRYIASFMYGAGLNLGRIVDITGDINSTIPTLIAQSPSMGAATNTNGTGDLDIKNNGNGTFTFFVLTTNNGIGAYTFNPMAITVNVPPYLENFEGSFPPFKYVRGNGYMNMLLANSSSWAQDDFANITAPVNKSAKNNIFGTTRKDWIVTPTIDLGDGSIDYQLEFDLALTKYNATTPDTLGIDDSLAVVISTNNGLTWEPANVLQLWTASTLISNTGQHQVYNLSAYSGLVKFGFYGASSLSNKDNDIFIDNIQVREIPVNPIFAVNPTSHNYGNLQIGTVAPKSFVISNTGAGSLIITSAALISGTSYVKVDSATYPVSLANLESYSLGVNFAPLTLGQKDDTLRIVSNLGVHNVPLTGFAFDATVNNFPFTESFDAELFPPLGWLNVQLTGTGLFKRVLTGLSPAVTPHSGAAMVQYNSYSYSSGTSAVLISPVLNLTGSYYRVKFWMYRDNGYLTNVDRITVYLNNAPTMTGADSIGGVYRSINLFPAVAANGWYEYTFVIPGGAEKFVLLKGYSAFGNNIYIDDFTVDVAPDKDYAVTTFLQVAGIPAPFVITPSDNYMKKGEEETIFDLSQANFTSSSDVNNSLNFNVNRNENNLVIGGGADAYPPNVPVNLRTIVSNFGYQSPDYELQWSVDGVQGTAVPRTGIAVNSMDTVMLNTTPLNRGTLISVANAVVVGDTFYNNIANLYRTYVYPDSSIRIRYDNGTNLPSTFIGFNDSLVTVHAGVRFKATQNMQLANIDVYYRNENSIDSVEVQVRGAGFDTLAPGALLYSRKFSGLNYSSVDGDYFTLPLGTDAPAFLQNSEYWIVVKMKGAKFPIGAQSSLITLGKSFVSANDTLWSPLIISTTQYAWLIRTVGVSYTPPPPPPTFTVWQRTVANGNLPSWFGADTERGMAWGRVYTANRSLEGRVFVVSRNGGTAVKILDDSLEQI